MTAFRRRVRQFATFASTIGAALLLIAISASLAGAAGAPGSGDGFVPTKICHVQGGSQVTLTIDNAGALNGHFPQHQNDYYGECQEDEEEVVDACPGDLNPGIQEPGSECIVDACPDALNPGVQAPGTTCIVEEVVDACPDALNPGIQAPGTTCIVEEVVDACPDALNPGIQSAGTTCITGSDSTPGSSDSGAPSAADGGGDDIAAGVDVEADSLTIETVQNDGPATIGGEQTVAGAVDAPATGGGTSAVGTTSGSLPVTGGAADLVAALGAALLLLGIAGQLVGRRLERRAAA